jgi:hypothetical protein
MKPLSFAFIWLIMRLGSIELTMCWANYWSVLKPSDVPSFLFLFTLNSLMATGVKYSYSWRISFCKMISLLTVGNALVTVFWRTSLTRRETNLSYECYINCLNYSWCWWWSYWNILFFYMLECNTLIFVPVQYSSIDTQMMNNTSKYIYIQSFWIEYWILLRW